MRGIPVRFVDFRGGVNTSSAPYLVADNEARDARNVVSTVRGSIKKRNGNQTFASVFPGAPSELVSLFPCQEAATVLIATGGSKIYSIATSGTVTDITGAAVLTSGTKWEWIEAPSKVGQGPLYGMDGVTTPKQWVGSGNIADWTATSGTLPNGKYMKYFANRVFVAGVAGSEQTLYWSDAGDPRSWPAINFVTLSPEDGEPITGIGNVGPYLLVFKRNKTYVVYDPDTGANRQLSDSIGCPAHRTIAESPHGTFFLSEDGAVYQTNGSTLTLISDNVRTTLEGIVAAERMNAAGAFFENHYYLAIATSGASNNLVLDYDLQLQSWWIHDNTVNQFAIWRTASTADAELYAAKSGTAVLDRCYVDGTTQDNGTNFRAYWRGPWIAFKEPYRHKRVRRLHLDGSGSVDVYLGTDFTITEQLLELSVFPLSSSTTFGGSGLFGGDGTFGDTPAAAEATLFSLGVGRAFSVRLECTSNLPMEIDAITFLYTPRQN